MLSIRSARGDRLEEISREAAIDLLRRGDGKLWLHCDKPSEEELQFLQQNFSIHHLTIEDIVRQNQRPKLEPFENYVYLAIHSLRREGEWKIVPSEMDLLLGRGWLLSVHYGALPGADRKRQAPRKNPASPRARCRFFSLHPARLGDRQLFSDPG